MYLRLNILCVFIILDHYKRVIIMEWILIVIDIGKSLRKGFNRIFLGERNIFNVLIFIII